MNKFEFISIKEFPEGQYPTAIATVRINLKDSNGYPVREVVRYARKNTKDGGHFWAMATHNVTVNGEKKYLSGYSLDSSIDEEMLIEFIKENSKIQRQNQAQMQYPHGMAQNSMPMPPEFPTSMDMVPNEQSLPF